MGPAEVQRCWPWLSRLLRPAVEVDGTIELEKLREQIVGGNMGLATVHAPKTAGIVVIHPVMLSGVYCLWIPYIAGRIEGGPKHWLRTMRGIMAHFVALATKAGCDEVRIGGRDYTNIFPDFERFDPDHPNRLRKVLRHG
jgi:hypothetical protein